MLPMTIPPPGTVTFLFADIDGHPQRWEHESEAARTLLDRPIQIVREAIERHGGYVFEQVNGSTSAFEIAANGLAAVIAGQRALVEAAVALAINED
jgi:class 3 adenylate cyclase